jgi:Flp pilus assembly pilin Flp
MFKQLWADDTGAILATEYTLLSGIVVFGVAGSMVGIRDQINHNFTTIGDNLKVAMPDPKVMQSLIAPVPKHTTLEVAQPVGFCPIPAPAP